MKKSLSLAFCFAALSGCSHEVAVTYDCVPSGATVYEKGIGKIGTCPVTVKYNTDDVKVHGGQLSTDSVEVVWLSGASVTMPATSFVIPDSRHASFTFTRPKDFLGAGKDEEFSINYESSLPTQEQKYLVTPSQDKSIFDGINNSGTCLIYGLTQNVNAQCD